MSITDALWKDEDGGLLFYHDTVERVLVVRSLCCRDRIFWGRKYTHVYCAGCREALRNPLGVPSTYIFLVQGVDDLTTWVAHWTHADVDDIEVTLG